MSRAKEVGDYVTRQASLSLTRPLSEGELRIGALLSAVPVVCAFHVWNTRPLEVTHVIPLILGAVAVLGLVWMTNRSQKHRHWQRARAADPQRPWTWDFAWNRGPVEVSGLREDLRRDQVWGRRGGKGARPSPLAERARTIGVVVVGVALLSSRAWPTVAARPFVVAFWFAIAAVGAFLFLRSRDLLAARVDIPTFPILVGETFDLSFGVDEDGGHFDTLRFVLRCLEEDGIPWHGTQVRCVVLAQHVIDVDTGRIPEPGADLLLPVEIPPDAPATDFTDARARYWELSVQGAGAFGKFERTFLLPVYAA